MKRTTILTLVALLLLSIAMPTVARERKERGARLQFSCASHDFGTVSRRGNDLVCEFEFENSGDEPLVVLSVTTSCSCLKAECSRKPVSPGERGVVRIMLEANKVERGVFHRVIQVRSNSIEGDNILTVQGRAE